jgi:hypothetical protein
LLALQRVVPQAAVGPPQELQYLVVLDFEATCVESGRINPQEIIEFPCVLLNCATQQVRRKGQIEF